MCAPGRSGRAAVGAADRLLDELVDVVKHHADGVDGCTTKRQSLDDLSAEACHTLEEQQVLFQHVTRELSDLIEKDEGFLSEMTPAAEFFFGGRKPPPHIKSAADDERQLLLPVGDN